ncbi:OmpA family protein [uncultured Limimaricola sp.]|uniref:OmpA family protein n=1 Tax=uncultured Limimaricola sp. TaxID=2211667 RepID=UPI0030F98DC7
MIRAALLLVLWPGIGAALELPVPAGAVLTAETQRETEDYALPIGPAQDAPPPMTPITGRIETRAWRITPNAPPPAGLIAPIRAALEASGFDILLDCAAEACGGFDFRFGTEVLPPPEMHVDLGSFRFLSARRDTPRGPEAVSALASRTGNTGHLQVISVTPEGAPPVAPSPAPPPPAGEIASALSRDGHAVLDGIAFAPGAATLGAGGGPALAALAAWLSANPKLRIVLVGHTDMTGALDANIALSRRRAEAVRDRLLRDHGLGRERIDAQGAGWLAPRATNATKAGRAANRRVEAVVSGG